VESLKGMKREEEAGVEGRANMRRGRRANLRPEWRACWGRQDRTWGRGGRHRGEGGISTIEIGTGGEEKEEENRRKRRSLYRDA
jgi:hypothetical protein